jgi:hypothetical protein
MKHVDVKPLTHWIIYRGYKVRFTQREPTLVAGILTNDTGTVSFTYDPNTYTVQLPSERLVINAYGWELRRSHSHPKSRS